MATEILQATNFMAERTPTPIIPPRITKTLELFSVHGGSIDRQDLISALCPGATENPNTIQIAASTISAVRSFIGREGKTIVYDEVEGRYDLVENIILQNGKEISITGEKQREAAQLLASSGNVITFKDLYPEEENAQKGNRNLKGVVSKLRKPFESADYSIAGKTIEGVTQYKSLQGAPKRKAKLENGKKIDSKSSIQNNITEFLSRAEKPLSTTALIEIFFDPSNKQLSQRKLRAAMKDIQLRLGDYNLRLRITPQSERGSNLYEITYSGIKGMTREERRVFWANWWEKQREPAETEILVPEEKKAEYAPIVTLTRAKYLFSNKGLSDQALDIAGQQAFDKAKESYEPEKGYSFEEYADFFIRGTMGNMLLYNVPEAPADGKEFLLFKNRELIHSFKSDLADVMVNLSSRKRFPNNFLSPEESRALDIRLGITGKNPGSNEDVCYELDCSPQWGKRMAQNAITKIKDSPFASQLAKYFA